MAITEQRAFEIQVARGFTVELGPEGWLCRLPSGARVRTEPEPTPVEALGAAEAHLAEREAVAVEYRAARVLQDLNRGEIYVRPRTVSVTVEGERVDRTVFDAVRTADETLLAEGLASVTEAAIKARETGTPRDPGAVRNQ